MSRDRLLSAGGGKKMNSLRRISFACLVFGGVAMATPAVAQMELVNGDVNGDDAVDVADPIYLLQWLFTGGPEPAVNQACCQTWCCAKNHRDNGDVNADGARDISDAIRLLTILFFDRDALRRLPALCWCDFEEDLDCLPLCDQFGD